MAQVEQAAKRTTRKAQAAPHIPSVIAQALKPAPETEVATQAPRLVPPIPQSAMQDAAFARNWWRVVIDGERTPYDSVLTDVTVWGPNEAKLRAGDLVEVLDEQSTLFALLYLVEHVPAKFIRFAQLIKASLGGVAIGRIEARGNHYAQWRGLRFSRFLRTSVRYQLARKSPFHRCYPVLIASCRFRPYT